MLKPAFVALLLFVGPVSDTTADGPSLRVVAVEPTAGALAASTATPIVVHFDRPVDPATVLPGPALRAFGRWSGPASGAVTLGEGDRSVRLVPDHPFSSGEQVTVSLDGAVRGQDGSTMRPGGHAFRFWTRAQPAPASFAEIDRLSTRRNVAEVTRSYGGIASDLDGDRALDLTIVNEISADLRVFLNLADGSGGFGPMLQPPSRVGTQASPSEPADFDGDGVVDIGVVNIADDTVSILLGNGDGSFAPGQVVPVGDVPRGIAVLDADGDGDDDIVNTNANGGAQDLSLLRNDGSGVFGPPTFFASGLSGAWALASADMTGDGILDLVVGARFAAQVAVLAGNGDGTFTGVSVQSAGGAVWMLGCGDVDGDGHEDVATANSTDDSGSILLGDGAGGLAAPQTYATDPFPLATDLGDYDGDGDLDWITSSFSGDWWAFRNDGAGGFVFDQELAAPSAASCSLMLDLENDGDLDLALVDELTDEVLVMRNGGIGSPPRPPAVPAGGAAGTPLRLGKLDAGADGISVAWDATSCDTYDHHLLFGVGSQLPAAPGGSYALAGSRCGLGAASPFDWLASPDPASDSSGLVWLLVVAGDGDGTEGSWGRASGGTPRAGAGTNGASNECGYLDRDLTSACGTAPP